MSSISCARTGVRPAKTAHAPLAEAHTDSARNTSPTLVLNILPDPRDCMLQFGIPALSTRTHETVFSPSSLGCQRSQTFLALNPEQTVPFDVNDVRRTGEAGRAFVSQNVTSDSTHPPGSHHAILRNHFDPLTAKYDFNIAYLPRDATF